MRAAPRWPPRATQAVQQKRAAKGEEGAGAGRVRFINFTLQWQGSAAQQSLVVRGAALTAQRSSPRR